MTAGTATTATGPVFYECPDCGERGPYRRCPDCNLFTRRLGPGGHCPSRDELILITELLQTPQPQHPHTQTT